MIQESLYGIGSSTLKGMQKNVHDLFTNTLLSLLISYGFFPDLTK